MAKTLEHYRALPYTRRVRVEVEDDGEEYFVAFIEELESVVADGDTAVEALNNLRAAFDDFITAMIEWDSEVPEPQSWPASLGWEMQAPAGQQPAISVDSATVGTQDDEPEWLRNVVPGLLSPARGDLQTTGSQ